MKIAGVKRVAETMFLLIRKSTVWHMLKLRSAVCYKCCDARQKGQD